MTFNLPWRDAPTLALGPDERVLAEVPRPPSKAWMGAAMLLLAVLAQRFVPGIRAVWLYILGAFILTRMAMQALVEADWALTDRRLVRMGVFGTRAWAWERLPTARAIRTLAGPAVVFEDERGRRVAAIRTFDPEPLLKAHRKGRGGARVHLPSSP